AGLTVPDENLAGIGAIERGRGDPRFLGMKSEARDRPQMIGKRLDFFAVRQLPAVDARILAAGEKLVAVGAETDPVDIAEVPQERWARDSSVVNHGDHAGATPHRHGTQVWMGSQADDSGGHF